MSTAVKKLDREYVKKRIIECLENETNLNLDPINDRETFDLYQSVYDEIKRSLFVGKSDSEVWRIQEIATRNSLNEII